MGARLTRVAQRSLQAVTSVSEEAFDAALALLEVSDFLLHGRHAPAVRALHLGLFGVGIRDHLREGRRRLLFGLLLPSFRLADRRLARLRAAAS
jgi:hypothetical protein